MTAAVTGTPSLAAALAAFQEHLPHIGKGAEGRVGNSPYKYADLADVAAAVMPLLGRVGLSFIAKPTLADGRFVLAYSLLHSSGEREDGTYPLPENAGPQQQGSAITYAKRYSLCAVTGVAPDGDDDGASAQAACAGAGEEWEGAAEIDAAAQELAELALACSTPDELAAVTGRARQDRKMNALVKNPDSGRTGVLALLLEWRRRQLAEVSP